MVKKSVEKAGVKVDRVDTSVIDWRVQVSDGERLTDPKYTRLLDALRLFLCVQTHPDALTRPLLDPIVARSRVMRGAALVDYFLLHAGEFALDKYGFEALTEGDLLQILGDLSQSNSVVESVYQWSSRLTEYLRRAGESLSEECFRRAVGADSDLTLLTAGTRTLDLNDDQLLRARAYLLSAGFYSSGSSGSRYRLTPNTRQLARKLYPNCIRGLAPKPIFEELCIGPKDSFGNEYPAAPVRDHEESYCSELAMKEYRAALRNFRLVARAGASAPSDATLNLLDKKGVIRSLPLKSVKRFRTLHPDLVLTSLRNAIAFFLDHGEHLLDDYANVVVRTGRGNLHWANFCQRAEVNGFLTDATSEMGVRCWHLTHQMSRVEFHPLSPKPARPTSADYFQRMRNNEGLIELVRVLYGAIAIVVGTLSARRQAELLGLRTKGCIDGAYGNLIFQAGKTGYATQRQVAARPIPRIAIRMIESITRFQARLHANGLCKADEYLFAVPSPSGRLVWGNTPYNEALDAFCDYFETARTTSGHRHYVRQHQLRRFFAQMFFWAAGLGDMDTLRWFLGHADVSHVWHYITESTPGAVLLEVKAQFVTEALKRDSSAFEALGDLLASRFGTRAFYALSDEQLEQHIEDLLSAGDVEVEPEFFDTPSGQSYRILVRVLRATYESRAA